MPESKKFEALSPIDLKKRMEKSGAVHLIDTLPKDRFQSVHLPGAQNACVYEVTFVDQVRAITPDADADIVLYASSDGSMAAHVAAEKLARAGYRRLHLLEGGSAAWRAAGMPLDGKAVAGPDDPGTLLNLADGTYRVDTDRSLIEWTGRNPNSTHVGQLGIAAGDITVRNQSATGSFDIDMTSITNINLEGDELQPVLISHLKSDDFFLVKLFPKATFRITDARPFSEPYLTYPNYEVSGILTLRGIAVEQNFSATLTQTADGALAAEAHFDFDRTRWGIIYGSTRFFEHLGMHLVFDHISIQLRIFAR